MKPRHKHQQLDRAVAHPETEVVGEGAPLRTRTPPGSWEIRPETGVVPANRAGVTHGWHSQDAVQIPTSLTCNLCPLYHVRRKDRRHPLACREGKKHQVCPILTGLQERWAASLICEVQEATGAQPRPSDNARIEQVVRHRSRIFQIENYLKVAGLIDLQKGEMRNVADRLTTTENALSRSLAEFRQAISEQGARPTADAPRLEDYLRALERESNGRGDNGGSS